MYCVTLDITELTAIYPKELGDVYKIVATTIYNMEKQKTM